MSNPVILSWIDYPIQNCHTSSGVRKRETPFGHKTVGSRTQSQQTRAITPEDEGRQIGLEKGDWIWRHGLHLFGPASHEVCWVLYETSELILVLWMRPWPGIGVYLNRITCTLWHEHVCRGFVVHIILTCVAVLSIMTYTWSSRRSSPDMNLAKFLMIFQEKELEPAYHLFVQYCKERPERSQDLQFLYEQVSNWAAQCTKQCSASSVESHFSDGFDRNFYNRVWLQESNANALAEFHLMEGIKSDDFNGRLSQLRSAAEKFKLQNEPHARWLLHYCVWGVR